jgi:hypothetical protein
VTGPVRDARPPLALVRVLNPTLRLLLRTPLGRLVRPFGLLEFHGRSSGRLYRVPVGVHRIDDELAVFSPAAWRQNFAGGRSATLRFRGYTSAVTGVLVAEPHAVATLLRSLEAGGTPLTHVGLRVAPGHELDADDVVAVDRAAICLQPRAHPKGR